MDEVAGLVLVRLRLVVLRQTGTDSLSRWTVCHSVACDCHPVGLGQNSQTFCPSRNEYLFGFERLTAWPDALARGLHEVCL